MRSSFRKIAWVAAGALSVALAYFAVPALALLVGIDAMVLPKVDSHPCAGKPCLVAAYRPGDDASAVPLDQVPLSKPSATAQLLLPTGKIVLRYRDATGKVMATDPR